MFWSIVWLLIGAALLIWGAERLVDGATILAEVFSLPKAFVGLTLVALGTSAPELFVNVYAAASGNSGFALANVSGSNLANLCIGLGVCAIMGGITIRRADFGRDMMVFAIAPTIVLTILTLTQREILPLWAVIPLSALMIGYGWSLRGRGNGQPESAELEDGETGLRNDAALNDLDDLAKAAPNQTAGRGVAFFLVGVVALYAGGRFTVVAAEQLADYWNIGREIIGLTIVALLTSIPDIAATWVAARRGENGIAVGNIVGSNISNIVLVLNATVLTAGIFGGNQVDLVAGAADAIPSPIGTARLLQLDYLIVALLSMTAWGIVLYRERLGRGTGVFFLVSYLVYLTFRVATVLG